ncbi:GNAT family N-acetyltransferase [Streptomyces kaniharaensis]|uniref:GNAT family N-acetyltransferase n=1 Tax=Streptomyces kaniharaensis TaxID=212423 RepID=UPI0018A845A1|nr:GNAT family N-acetyltransferase [Streptomyces kaniharaensis]
MRYVRRAWWVAGRPERLPRALIDLLAGADIVWHPHGLGPDPAAVPAGLRWPHPAGGTLTAARAARGFGVGEVVGAQILVALARLPRRLPQGRRVLLPGGHVVTLRPACLRDRRAVTVLDALCGRLQQPWGLESQWLLTGWEGQGVLAMAADGRPVAFAGLVRDEPGAEAVLLIAPAWWERGLGELLVRELVTAARQEGLKEVWTHTFSGDAVTVRAMRSAGLPVAADDDGISMTLSLSLDPAPGPPRQSAESSRPSVVRQGGTGP